MDTVSTAVTAGGMTALLIEVIKWFWRRYVVKDVTYDFPSNFYLVATPVLNLLMQPLLALLLVSGYTFPTDWLGYFRLVVVTLLGSLISLVSYTDGIRPLKNYIAMHKQTPPLV